MIGSHDTYTYQKAKSWWVNLISKFWRCQKLNLQEQFDKGVRFFDIRVFRDGDVWRTAHGLAEFNTYFSSIRSICNHFDIPGIKFRIWLEKGSDLDWDIFKIEALECKDDYPGFVQAFRKFKESCFTKSTHPKMEYYACEMEKPENFLKGVYTNPIKDYAEKHNPIITQEMKDDPNTVYFMDYV